MKIDFKIVIIGALALGWAYDLRVGKWYQKKYEEAKVAATTYRNLADSLESIVHLYAGKLDQHQIPIPIDEFDRIVVMNNLRTFKE